MIYQEWCLKSKWFSDLVPKNPKKATATLTFTGVVIAAETVTIDDQIYEFVAVAGDIADPANIPVVVGVTLTADNGITKLTEAITANSEVVTAVKDTTADTVVITYIAVGTAGNDIAVSTTLTNASWGVDVTKLSNGQYGTPCPEKNTLIFVTPYYHLCTKAGNKDDVEWKRFTPAAY